MTVLAFRRRQRAQEAADDVFGSVERLEGLTKLDFQLSFALLHAPFSFGGFLLAFRESTISFAHSLAFSI
jgi:hypothetical protein